MIYDTQGIFVCSMLPSGEVVRYGIVSIHTRTAAVFTYSQLSNIYFGKLGMPSKTTPGYRGYRYVLYVYPVTGTYYMSTLPVCTKNTPPVVRMYSYTIRPSGSSTAVGCLDIFRVKGRVWRDFYCCCNT